MAERIFCAHADRDGLGAHWKFEGDDCPTPCERCGRPFRRCSPKEKLCDKCYFGYDPAEES